MPFLEISRENYIATVTLNDPAKLNALGAEFWETSATCFAELDDDAQVRCIVVRGAGRAFTSGLDLMAILPKLPIQLEGGPPDGALRARLHRLIRSMQGAITAIARCRTPTIAAVHGHCIGAGVDLITACDMRLAAQQTNFSVRETKLAMIADLGTLQQLPAIVGPGIARELIFTGRDFDADYAHRIGLVNRVLDDAPSLHAAAGELAQEICANPPLTVQGAKQVMNEACLPAVERSLEYVATFNAAHLVSQDFGVAVTAAMTKQKPEFSGR